MNYTHYLQQMLAPLGVYDLSESSFSGAEVKALGVALEEFWQYAQNLQKETILSTAGEMGISRWESVFPYRAPVESLEGRRAAIQGFLSISGDDFTLEKIRNSIAACGVVCVVEESETAGVVEIRFPGVVGEPDNYSVVQMICREMIPSNLRVDYLLVFFTWADAATITWGDAEDYTWHELERLDITEL